MRSIKYELQGADKQVVIDAVIHDNKRLYGALNFNDYLASPNEPNLLDFWLRALSLGFVFSNQNSIENEFLQYLGKRTVWQECFDELNDELRERLDEIAFQEFLIRTQRGVESKNVEQRKKIVLRMLKKDTESDILNEIAKEWANNFNPTLDQLDFKCELFNINKPKIAIKKISLSWAIDPTFQIIDTPNRTDFLDNIIKFYKDKCDETQTKRFLAIGDNGNYISGVFGNLYESLCTNDISEIADLLDELYGLGNKVEIIRRLNILKKLADNIGEPKLVNKWSDYRSDFNGTIESWYSNRESKQKDTAKQLKDMSELLENIYEILPKISEVREGILRDSIEFIQGEKSLNITRDFTNELDSYLATLRTDLNEYVQQNKELPLPRDWQKKLSKHMQSSPLFFGENKITLWEQLKSLKNLISVEINKLEGILVDNYSDYEITDKQVDMLAQLYNRIKNDGNKIVISILEDIANKLGVNFSDRTDRASYLDTNSYRRREMKILPIPHKLSTSKLITLSKLGDLYNDVKSTPQDNYILRDVTQLSKIILSALVRHSHKEREVTLIHSNLSGYANLISKQKLICRYPIQSVNGSQNLLGYNESGRYFYKFNDIKFPEIEKQEITFATQGNNFSSGDQKFWSKKSQNVPALGIWSSRYQIQFLEWFFGKHSRKKTWLSAGGSFTIVEKNIQIDWSDVEPKVIDEYNDRIFVSQPFTINPPKNRLVDINDIKGRYIGIDIGEYGLAWSLIEANGNKIKQIASGFLADKQQRTLKNDVKALRNKQVRATFTSPDTKIARVRESLIGSYRNQLEDLAIRHRARLSFEYEVSAFETGGAKISKIYDSIKRGSVVRKENNAENKQAWGNLKNDEFIWKAYETTAAGTSRICTKCKHDNSEFVDWDNGEKLYDKVRPNLGDGRKRAYAEEKLKGTQYSNLINDEWIKQYGTIALFICQNPKCNHIAHADLQAAFNIAIRGYLKDINPIRAKESSDYKINEDKNKIIDKGLNRNFLTTEQSKLEFDPIIGL